MQSLTKLAFALAASWAGLSGLQTDGNNFWLEFSQVPNFMKAFGALAALVLWNKMPGLNADSKNLKEILGLVKKFVKSPYVPMGAFALLPILGALSAATSDPRFLMGLVADSAIVSAIIGRKVFGVPAIMGVSTSQKTVLDMVKAVIEQTRGTYGGAALYLGATRSGAPTEICINYPVSEAGNMHITRVKVQG